MIKVSVIYPKITEKRFDLDYYSTSHAQLVTEKLGPLGLLGFEIDKGSEAFLVKADLLFESMDSFNHAMAEAGEELTADAANCTDMEPTIEITEVVYSNRLT